ncbi:MAG TPA: S-layer homology domain-containing protein [Abditibacteriaceae bacterium]|jgi:hypothetical protein
MNNRKFRFMIWAFILGPTIAKADPQPIIASPRSKEAYKSPFADVPQDHWASSAAKFAFYFGLMEGDDHGHFNGDTPLRRDDVAIVIHRLFRMPGPLLANPPAAGTAQSTKSE